MKRDYWIPRTKRQLVETISLVYPNDRSLNGKSKNQLYAIFYKLREWRK